MNTWLEKVLEFWESDEAATRVDEPANHSEGALDSRGSPEIRNLVAYENGTVPHGIQAQKEETIHNKRSFEYDSIRGSDAFGNGFTGLWIDAKYDKHSTNKLIDEDVAASASLSPSECRHFGIKFMRVDNRD